MVAKFNSKTHVQNTFFVFEPFRPRLASKFEERAQMMKKCFLLYISAFLLTLKPNAFETLKKTKKYFINVSWSLGIPFYIYFRSGRLHFVKKVIIGVP